MIYFLSASRDLLVSFLWLSPQFFLLAYWIWPVEACILEMYASYPIDNILVRIIGGSIFMLNELWFVSITVF